MTYDEILFSKFSEPAKIFSIAGDKITTLKVNDKFLYEMGMNIDMEEYVHADVMTAFDDSNKEIFLTAVRNCINSGEETSCETWQKLISNCCGADAICIRSRLVYIGNENGVDIVYEAIRNITAERHSFDTLKESERRFKIASDQINIYYWEYTVATKEMRPCFRCMRDLGLPALVKNYPEPAIEAGIFPPDYADMYRDWHRQIEAGVKELEGDIPLTVGRVPFRVRYTTEFDADGKPYKAYGSATLISETEIKQIKLDNSIIEALADDFEGIFIADLNMNTMRVVKLSEGSLPFDLAEHSFTEDAAMLAQIFSEQYGETLNQFSDVDALRTTFFENTNSREFTFKSKISGRWGRMVFRVIETLRDEVSKILITYSVIDDLQAQKIDAERLIAEQKKELESRQIQLLKAVDEANRANKAKSDFLARMSHEIRTPMNAIMGMNEIILKNTTDDAVKSYADDAYHAATGLLGTINEILDFSKIESGKMELVEDNFNFGAFIGSIYNLFALRAEDKDLALIFDIDEKLPAELYGDELRIRQILTNLLSNAVKYTDRGTITLAIKLKERRPDAATMRFEVTDTGRGIRKEDMVHLFEAFERIDETNNKNIEGTGLGMNITLRLLEMMNSKLEVESTYGEGSVFAFTLTLKTGSPAFMGDFREKLEETAVTGREKPLYVNENTNVLVVDDNVVNLRVIAALLKATNMKLTMVSSGEAALKATMKKKFDLIFLDHFMPVMSGPETLEKLKAQTDGKNSDTPVIVLTANAIKGSEEEYIKMGFDDVVYKPTTQNELNAIIWKYLGDD